MQVCFDAAMKGQNAEKKLLSRQIRQLRAVLQDPAQTPILATGPSEAAQAGFRRLENGRHVAYMKLDRLGPLLDLDTGGVERLLKELLCRKRIEPGVRDPYTRPVPISGRSSIKHLVFTASMLKSASVPQAVDVSVTEKRAPMAVPMGRNVMGDPVPLSRLMPRPKARARKPRWAGGRPR